MKDRTGQKIVLATGNRGKVLELAPAFVRLGHELLGLADFPEIGEIEENGSTFAENALIKARHVAARTGLVSVADDSGLQVDALSGAPGIFSARYADDIRPRPGESRDERNIRKLLDAMRNMADRKCRFVTVMAAVRPDGVETVAEGVWEGELLRERRGENGFGYDPVFFDPRLGKSAAELERAEKNAVSHRGRAVRALLAAWPGFMLA